ncbi:hypothetical protein P8C59_006167 [Phyllachora maydis]|uniref:Asd-4/GZF3-like helical region domain-containing protein n=1 Tax=Phyllachora maydis TaxID=1825666 RepID=A0AAD9I703_9PEZI|nr:hypothetical protein P8C59_006167 [Phyllachora maydis]
MTSTSGEPGKSGNYTERNPDPEVLYSNELATFENYLYQYTLADTVQSFAAEHSRPRWKQCPIMSKLRHTDHAAVASRRDGLPKQRKQNQAMAAAASDLNGLDPNGVNTAARRVSQQRPSNGHVDDPNSPISRTGTPNMYGAHGGLPLYHGIDDTQFQTQGLPGFSVPGTSPGRAPSPLNGEMPQTSESLLAANASLKTRVSELEVIQELYRSRLAELEQGEANSRQAQEMSDKTEVQLRAQLDTVTESEAQLRKELEESHRRENMLKRRLDDLEAEFRETKVAMQAYESGRAKKPRLEVDEAEMQEMKEEQSPVAETVPEEPHAQ